MTEYGGRGNSSSWNHDYHNSKGESIVRFEKEVIDGPYSCNSNVIKSSHLFKIEEDEGNICSSGSSGLMTTATLVDQKKCLLVFYEIPFTTKEMHRKELQIVYKKLKVNYNFYSK